MTEAHWKPSEAPTCRVCESAIYVCDSWADRRPVPCAGYDLRKAEARVAELEAAFAEESWRRWQADAIQVERAAAEAATSRVAELEAERGEDQGVIRVWRGRTERAEARVAELEAAHQRADNIESQAYNGLARGHAPRVDKAKTGPGGIATPWPARSVVDKLAEATSILLIDKDYDGHGWELIKYALDVAQAWLRDDPERVVCASNELVDLAKEIDEWWTKRIESQNASADTFVTSTPAPVSVKSTDANAAASTPSATNEPRSSNAPAVIDRATSTEADVQAAIRDAVVSGRGLTIAENGITRMQIAARRPVQDYDDPRSNEAPADVHPPLTNYGRNGRWNHSDYPLFEPGWKVVQPDGYIVAEGTRQFCEGAMFALKAYTTSDAYSVEQNDACTAKAEVK